MEYNWENVKCPKCKSLRVQKIDKNQKNWEKIEFNSAKAINLFGISGALSLFKILEKLISNLVNHQAFCGDCGEQFNLDLN